MEQTREQMIAPLTAQDITAELMQEEVMEQESEGAQAAQELGELEARLREGIGMLFEDGWSAEELDALSQDEGVRMDIADGMDLIRAALKMLRRQKAAPRRHGLPLSRASAAGAAPEGNPIDSMSDAQFDAFSRQARAAALMGKKVKM